MCVSQVGHLVCIGYMGYVVYRVGHVVYRVGHVVYVVYMSYMGCMGQLGHIAYIVYMDHVGHIVYVGYMSYMDLKCYVCCLCYVGYRCHINHRVSKSISCLSSHEFPGYEIQSLAGSSSSRMVILQYDGTSMNGIPGDCSS